MSDTFVQILPNSTGAKIDCSQVTVGGQSVDRQRINTADPTDPNAIAGVTATSAMEALASSAYGALANVPMVKDVAEAIKQMSRIMGRTLSLAMNPSTGELRALISTVTSVATVTSVTGVTTLNNLNSQSVQTTLMTSTDRAEWALTVRARIT